MYTNLYLCTSANHLYVFATVVTSKFVYQGHAFSYSCLELFCINHTFHIQEIPIAIC